MEGEPNGRPHIYPGGAFIVHHCSLSKSTLSLNPEINLHAPRWKQFMS